MSFLVWLKIRYMNVLLLDLQQIYIDEWALLGLRGYFANNKQVTKIIPAIYMETNDISSALTNLPIKTKKLEVYSKYGIHRLDLGDKQRDNLESFFISTDILILSIDNLFNFQQLQSLYPNLKNAQICYTYQEDFTDNNIDLIRDYMNKIIDHLTNSSYNFDLIVLFEFSDVPYNLRDKLITYGLQQNPGNRDGLTLEQTIQNNIKLKWFVAFQLSYSSLYSLCDVPESYSE